MASFCMFPREELADLGSFVFPEAHSSKNLSVASRTSFYSSKGGDVLQVLSHGKCPIWRCIFREISENRLSVRAERFVTADSESSQYQVSRANEEFQSC